MGSAYRGRVNQRAAEEAVRQANIDAREKQRTDLLLLAQQAQRNAQVTRAGLMDRLAHLPMSERRAIVSQDGAINDGTQAPVSIGLLQSLINEGSLFSAPPKAQLPQGNILEHIQRQREALLEGVPALSNPGGFAPGTGGLLANFATQGAEQIAKGQTNNPTILKAIR